jgi:hypothetical protein
LAGAQADGARVKLPHTMLDGALKLRAAEYAASLYVGATVDANDRRYLAETGWGQFLDEALATRDLMLDGDQVVPILRRRDAAE